MRNPVGPFASCLQGQGPVTPSLVVFVVNLTYTLERPANSVNKRCLDQAGL